MELEFIRSYALALPNLAKFAIGMAFIVGIPPLCRRVRLPGVVGLLFVGVLLGPHGLDFFGEKRPIADFLSDLGKLLLMFFAGLEIDVKLFQETRGRSLGFGLLTCAIPQILGTAVALAAGYGTNAAIVIGSFLGSHTLLAFPILQKLGAVRLQSITGYDWCHDRCDHSISNRFCDLCPHPSKWFFAARSCPAAYRDSGLSSSCFNRSRPFGKLWHRKDEE